MANLITYRGSVLNWECDNVGHMNVMYYVNRFEVAGRYLMSSVGLTAKTLKDNNWAGMVVRQEINYHKEVFELELLYIESSILEIGNRSFILHHKMKNGETGELVSDVKATCVILNKNTRTSVYIPELIRLRMVEMMS